MYVLCSYLTDGGVCAGRLFYDNLELVFGIGVMFMCVY